MIGFAFATGWAPSEIRRLTLPELSEVSRILKMRERARRRRRARRR